MKSTDNDPVIVDKRHFWYPLSPEELWPPFVHSMMTILDEIHQESKYDHLELVEFYEWIARIALRHADIKKFSLAIDQESSVDVFRHE